MADAGTTLIQARLRANRWSVLRAVLTSKQGNRHPLNRQPPDQATRMKNPTDYGRSINRPMWGLLPDKALRVLDVGGGHGSNAAAVKAHCGAEVAGVVDISDSAIRNPDPNVDFAICSDIEQPNAIEAICDQHGPFDLILCLDVLEHLVDPWRMIWRLHQTMPPGATLIASIPNVQNYRGIIRTVTGSWNYRDSGLFDRTHLRFFGKESAIELVECSGLVVNRVERALGHHRAARLADQMSFGLLAPFTTLQYQIRATRPEGSPRDPGMFGANVTPH